jgi:hypothetical protein
MGVVISEVEHRPSADSGADGAPGPAAPAQPRAIGADEVLAVLRRDGARRARLWAD